MKLKGMNALVTGSGRNIGRSIALSFAKEGANVVVNARTNQEEAEAVAQEVRALGRQALPIVADISDYEAVQAMVERVLKEWSTLDILVCNAAIRPFKPYLEMTPQDWREVMAANLDSAFYLTRCVLPHMVERRLGNIIFITGGVALVNHKVPVRHRTHALVSKAGVVGLLHLLAAEFGPCGIRVNGVAPGTMETTRAHPEWYPEQYYPGVLSGSSEERLKDVPLRRDGLPEEVAAACVFLTSSDSAYTTGQTINVSGGLYMA